MAELITTNVIGIAAVLRKIDNSVSFIAHSLPVSVRPELPAITVPATVTRTNFAPPLPGRGTYTANSAAGTATPAAPGMAELITTNVTGIAAVLRKIDNSVSFIAHSLPVSVRPELPAITAPETATPAVPGMAELITRNVIGIAAVLRKIDNSVSFIAHSLPVSVRPELPAITAPETATRTSFKPPRIRMGGDEGANDYLNPRNIAPVTQAERMAYSLQERRETVVIEVAAEKGTAAHIVRAPRDVDIQLISSGGNA
jgi:hypothetical protein